MLVKSLKKLNEEVNQHVPMADRRKKFTPRIGLLVLARMPCDGLYELSVVILSITKSHCYMAPFNLYALT